MELDADYYAAACKRFEQHKAQGSLFVPDTPRDAYEQTDFIASALCDDLTIDGIKNDKI